MSTDPDVTRTVRSWLEEGVTALPDRVLDSVLDQLPTTPQRRARWPAWRFHSMSSPLKIALVAATIGALAVVSLDIPPRSPDIAAAPAPSPSPRTSPAPLGGYAPDLTPGTYHQPIWDGPGRWTVTVPEGWEVFYGILWNNVDGQSDPDSVGGPGAVALSWEEAPVNVVADPCDSIADPPVGPTVDDLANAFAEQVGSDPSGPTEVTFGGYPAKRIELTAPADLDMATCDESLNFVWGVGGDTADVAGEVTVLYILDVEGDRMVMRAWHRPDASAEDVAEMEAMLASSVIDPPAPSPAASASPASLAWSPESLEQDWPAPVRAEPVGDPVIVPLERINGPEYADPLGDIGSSLMPWVDIVKLSSVSTSHLYVELAERLPSPVGDPSELWIAYGLVLDKDEDGVGDIRLGIDNMAEPGHRAWRTDLDTGRTESAAGSPYGSVGDSYFDTFYPGETLPTPVGPPGSARLGLDEGAFRFYAWASVIQDGRVVATDYAPDSGWLEAKP